MSCSAADVSPSWDVSGGCATAKPAVVLIGADKGAAPQRELASRPRPIVKVAEAT